MPIQVLDAHTAELIAAGEVVERPSSVVKELLENAIDAKASAIRVEIERGGIGCIRVQDDGCGIPMDEAPLAFLRHATSKVKCQQDLDAIATLGFRGEALASIASVARVELLSHAAGEENAGLYVIEGGREYAREEAARPYGTTFTIRDLFYNTPARMKFLKKDASEAGYVTETVTRLALSHPEVAFCYLREGKEVFATPGDGSLEAAIYAVLGREFRKDLLPLEGVRPPYALRGFVTSPRAGRGSRSMQFFYINGRFVKNRTMMAALEQAYRGCSMQGRFPGGVLFLTMPPELVDVNVHPAKTEVRFAAESEVFAAVYHAVKAALTEGESQHGVLQLGGSGGQKIAGGVVETVLHKPILPQQRPAQSPGRGELPKALQPEPLAAFGALASDEGVIPYQTKVQAPNGGPAQTRRPGEWRLDILPEAEETPGSANLMPLISPISAGGGFAEEFSVGLEKGHVSAGGQGQSDAQGAVMGTAKPPFCAENVPVARNLAPSAAAEKPAAEPLCYVGEVFATYILAQSDQTLYVIDKHAAHERILYEKLAAGRQSAGAQQLLTPVAVHLTATEKEALLENGEVLAESGIELEDFGAGGVMVRAIPADIAHTDVEGLIAEVARGLASGARQISDQKTEWVLHSMACRAAMKGGEKTQPGQLLHLAGQIVAGAVPPFCPHGRPVVLEITRKELEKQFGRLG